MGRFKTVGYLAVLLAVTLTQAAMKSSITQYGITWTFDKQYETGQFANGDYWVMGPVTINSISPGWNGTNHGSMVNPMPVPHNQQAYDRRMGSNNFNDSLLVQAPVTLQPNSSLISAVSWTDADKGNADYPHENTSGVPRPTLKDAAVLTVLAEIPPDNGRGMFRPPYVGTEKPYYFVDSLKKDLLPNLRLVEFTPDLGGVVDRFRRPWLDHFSHHGDGTQYSSPTYNMPGYGREYSITVGQAALALMLDEAALISTQGNSKDSLLIRFVQVGLDLFHMTEGGGYFWGLGGLNHGRKFPIIFFGLMFGNERARTIGSRSKDMPFIGFAEDCQTSYIDQAYVDVSNSPRWNPDTRADTLIPYQQKDIGLPEWDGGSCIDDNIANNTFGVPYRGINGRSYPGFILAARIMGQKEAWKHDPLFDYTDRWVAWATPIIEAQYPHPLHRATYIFGGQFHRAMWEAYRDDYGCKYVGLDTLTHKRQYSCDSCKFNCGTPIRIMKEPLLKAYDPVDIAYNPVMNTLVVYFNNVRLPGVIRVFNSRGTMVKAILDPSPTTVIKISDLESGVYFLYFSGDRYTQPYKIIIH